MRSAFVVLTTDSAKRTLGKGIAGARADSTLVGVLGVDRAEPWDDWEPEAAGGTSMVEDVGVSSLHRSTPGHLSPTHLDNLARAAFGQAKSVISDNVVLPLSSVGITWHWIPASIVAELLTQSFAGICEKWVQAECGQASPIFPPLGHEDCAEYLGQLIVACEIASASGGMVFLEVAV